MHFHPNCGKRKLHKISLLKNSSKAVDEYSHRLKRLKCISDALATKFEFIPKKKIKENSKILFYFKST